MLVYVLDYKSDILGVGLGASLGFVVSEEVEPAFCVCVLKLKSERCVFVWVRVLGFFEVRSDVRDFVIVVVVGVCHSHMCLPCL